MNAASTSLLGGGGVGGAIHLTAGKLLVDECRLLGGCKVGEAKLTKGYNLPVKHITHTVGPVWQDGKSQASLTKNCYHNSLQLAVNIQFKNIAFPCISTGVYKYPKEKAATIAIHTVAHFLLKSEELQEVIFCCFIEGDHLVYEHLLDVGTISTI